MHRIKWFYLISFSYAGRHYLMISNDIDRGWEEIEKFGYEYLDQIPYDGPEDWITQVQDMLNEELDGYAILDYLTPCYYNEDLNMIKSGFNNL